MAKQDAVESVRTVIEDTAVNVTLEGQKHIRAVIDNNFRSRHPSKEQVV